MSVLVPEDQELCAIRREAMAFANIGLFRFCLDGKLVFIDEGTLRIFGLAGRYPDPSVLVGVDVASLFHDEGASGSFREKALREGVVRGLEYQLRTLDGDDRWVLHNSYIVPDRDDGEPQIQVVAVDITDRKRAELALETSERRASALLRALPDLMFRITRDGTFLEFVSDRPEDLFVSPDRIVGASIHDILPTIADQTLEAIDRALDSGDVVAHEYALAMHDRERHYEARHVPCGDAEVLTVVRDVTDLHEAVAERLRLAERVQRGQRLESLGLLAGGIAHDFNNILTGILANAELALQELPAEGPAHARVERLRVGAQRAAELTGELLAYSGRGQFVVERVDVSELVSEMIALLDATVPKSATLALELDETGLIVEADATQIRQAVMSLVANASDALGETEGRIAIRTGRYRHDRAGDPSDEAGGVNAVGRLVPGEYVFVCVADTGSGMDEETRGRMFEPFFSTRFTGRGLGLAAVDGIVRGHGGAVRVRTAPGEGTAVTVFLPRATGVLRHPAQTAPAPAPLAEAAPEETAPAATAPQETAPVATAPQETAPVATAPQETAPVATAPQETASMPTRVLVADDESSVREVTEAVLEFAGFSVELAVDGRDAVERFSAGPERFDVVLLDMTMPRLGGVEALGEIRKIRPDIPVVLTSGYSEQDAIDGVGDTDRVGFVQKPFRAADLIATLRKALGPR